MQIKHSKSQKITSLKNIARYDLKTQGIEKKAIKGSIARNHEA